MKKLIMTMMLMPMMALASLTDGLVAYWPFDGNANDASGSGNHGVVHGATLTTDRNGNANGAYHFDGAQWIQVANNVGLRAVKENVTLSVWIKPTDWFENVLGLWMPVLCMGGDASRQYCFAFQFQPEGSSYWVRRDRDGCYYDFGLEDCDALSNEPITLNEWQHVALTFNGSVMTCYRNGIKVGETEAHPSFEETYEDLYIGSDLAGGDEYYYGDMDEVRLYNRALSAAEVKALYDGTAAPTTWYVDGASGSDSNSGTSESTPKATIQAAIDASSAGDTILVEPGTYAPIVTENKSITIQSTSGKDATIIDGNGDSRCAFLGTSTNECTTVLRGFTLKNGYLYISWTGAGGAGVRGGTVEDCTIVNCRVDGSWSGYGGEGGGVSDARILRCVIDDCKALAGGGISYSIVDSSIIKDCYARDDSGGVHYSVLRNCLLTGNYGYNTGGGGAGSAMNGCKAHNCTIVGNTARSGGTLIDSTLYNCIVFDNAPINLGGGYNSYEIEHNQILVLISCYTNSPGFVDAANGDYRLAAGSPCIDAGDNSYVTSDKDLAGNSRIVNGKVDIGCYEYDAAVTPPEPITYTVTFDLNGAGGTAPAGRNIAHGAAVGALPDVTRTGYSFVGWFTAARGGTKITASTTVTGDVTYYAYWTEIPTHPVTLGLDVIEASDITEPYSAPKAATLMGAVYEGNSVVGIVELKLGKVNEKKGTSKVSGSVTTLDGKKHAIMAYNLAGIDGATPKTVTLAAKDLGKMEVTIGGTRFAGSLGGWHVQSAAVGGNWTKGTATATVETGNLSMFAGTVLSGLLPDGEQAKAAGGKWTFAKAASVKWAKPKKGAAQPEIYDAASGKGLVVDDSKGKNKNLSGLKLTYTPKKGTFKGTFKVYALEGAGAKTKLKTYTVNVSGVVVDGVGYGQATCKKPTVGPWAVTVR